MPELGNCIGKCKNKSKCFFVMGYFRCKHLMGYSLVINFKMCIRCGTNILRYPTRTDNNEEVEMRRNILDSNDPCYCCKSYL